MRTTKEWRGRQRAALREDGWVDMRWAPDGPITVDYGPCSTALYALLDDVDALTTIALAAGLGADASAEEVAARVGEMRGALVEMHLASLDIEGLSPTESSTRWLRMIDADDAIDALARRLAEEAGRG